MQGAQLEVLGEIILPFYKIPCIIFPPTRPQVKKDRPHSAIARKENTYLLSGYEPLTPNP